MTSRSLILSVIMLLSFSVLSLSVQSKEIEEKSFSQKQELKFSDSLAGVLEKANQENQWIFVDFAARWCPPCIRLEHEVFVTETFKKAAQNYLLVRVDVDKEENYQWLQKYSVKAFPTLLILDPKGEERARYLDFMNAQLLADHLLAAQKERPQSLKERELAANQGSKIQAAELAEQLYRASKYEEALAWFNKAEVKNQSYYEALIARDKKKATEESRFEGEYQKTLEKAIQAFPESFASLEWRLELVDLCHQPSCEVEKKKTLEKNLDLVDRWIKDPIRQKVALQNGELVGIENLIKSELWANKAETFEKMSQKQKADEAWGQAVQQTLALNPDVSQPTKVIYLVYYMKHIKPLSEVEPWLEKLEKAYPAEFTYYQRHANLLFEKKEFQNALKYAKKAFELSYGSNRLSTGLLLAKIEHSLNHKTQAQSLISQLLSQEVARAPENKRVAKSMQEFAKEIAKP